MQRPRLGRNLTRRGHVRERTDLFGVTRLRLEKFILQLVDLYLSIRDEHAAREREDHRNGHYHRRATRYRGAAPQGPNRVSPRSAGAMGRRAHRWGDETLTLTRVRSARKSDDTHCANFHATRKRAERARGFKATSAGLASWALAFATRTSETAPHTHPSSTGQ